jgi:thiol-disulfide isomerase/thioredoxin
MKTKLVLVGVLAALAVAAMPMTGAAATATEDLKTLVEKVKQKASAGKTTADDLKPEIAEFDVLLAKYKGEKTDEVANIAMMKAMLYAQLLDDTDTTTKILNEVKADFPGTEAAKNVAQILESIEKSKAAKEISRKLVVGAPFPGFEVTDLDAKPLSTAGLKGRVVLIDFWATWCGPCIQEMPNVIKAYEKYQPQGLEIVGISLDQDKEALTNYVKDNKISWPQYFDGKGWQSDLVAKYGITGIPATFLLDREGNIAAKDLRGEALDAAIEVALKKK